MELMSITWRCIDGERNRLRWYSLTTGRDLWGMPTVIKRWGRLNGQRQERIEWVNTAEDVHGIVRHTLQNRRRHGYRLVSASDLGALVGEVAPLS